MSLRRQRHRHVAEPDQIRLFVREAQLAARLHHANIVQVS
jgi:hypothetical protein